MTSVATAHRVEALTGGLTADLLPVSQLRPGDRVFDLQGDLHPLVSVEPGSAGSVWIQRRDLNFAEHLVGRIMVVRAVRAHSPSGGATC